MPTLPLAVAWAQGATVASGPTGGGTPTLAPTAAARAPAGPSPAAAAVADTGVEIGRLSEVLPNGRYRVELQSRLFTAAGATDEPLQAGVRVWVLAAEGGLVILGSVR